MLLVSTPWASWESLSCPLGADRSHSRPQTRAFVVSFVCVMDWPGYFAAQNVTTWEGDGAASASHAGQWQAEVPSGSRGKGGTRGKMLRFVTTRMLSN